MITPKLFKFMELITPEQANTYGVEPLVNPDNFCAAPAELVPTNHPEGSVFLVLKGELTTNLKE